jgi:hypothetical protein
MGRRWGRMMWLRRFGLPGGMCGTEFFRPRRPYPSQHWGLPPPDPRFGLDGLVLKLPQRGDPQRAEWWRPVLNEWTGWIWRPVLKSRTG